MRTAPLLVLASALLALAACGEEAKPVAKPAPTVPDDWPKLSYAELPSLPPSYKLGTCVVCDKPLGMSPYVISYGGYTVAFDNRECIRGFASDPEGIIRRKINPKAVFDNGVKENR